MRAGVSSPLSSKRIKLERERLQIEMSRALLRELDRVCAVIEHGICAEIRLRGEDEMHECLADILDDAEKAPEERAKLLTG